MLEDYLNLDLSINIKYIKNINALKILSIFLLVYLTSNLVIIFNKQRI